MSTVCELTMLILSTSVILNATCLTITSLITKLCQQRWPIHSCSFYKVSALADLRYGGRFEGTLGQLISVCNSERIIKIGQYLPKLRSNEKWSSFFDSVYIYQGYSILPVISKQFSCCFLSTRNAPSSSFIISKIYLSHCRVLPLGESIIYGPLPIYSECSVMTAINRCYVAVVLCLLHYSKTRGKGFFLE